MILWKKDINIWKNESIHSYLTLHKYQLQRDQRPKHRLETMKLLEEKKIGRTLQHPGVRKHFLNKTVVTLDICQLTNGTL